MAPNDSLQPILLIINSTINPTGFALGVLKLPSDDSFTVLNAIVILAGVIVVVATRGRLGLRSDDCLRPSVGDVQ